ncbi:hypothetical protein ACJX0J_034685 [Zea mays]
MCLLFDHFCRGLAVVPYIHGFSIYHNQWKLSACLNLELEWLVPFDMIASFSANLTLGLIILHLVTLGMTIVFELGIHNSVLQVYLSHYYARTKDKGQRAHRDTCSLKKTGPGLLDVFLLKFNKLNLNH